MANTNVVVVYDQLEQAVNKLENYYTMLEEQQKIISRLDAYFDHLYKIHGKNTTFVSTMEDKIESMTKAIKNDMADIDYLKNLTSYIIQSYTDAEGKTTLRSNELLMTALGSIVPYSSSFVTSIYGNMSEYAQAIQIDPSKAPDISQYSDVKNWRTYTDTNAQTADAWDAVHYNTSESGEKYSYKISETGSKISTNAQNVAIQDAQKDVEEAEARLKEEQEKIEQARQEAEAAKESAESARKEAEAARESAESSGEQRQPEKKATTPKETTTAKPKAEAKAEAKQETAPAESGAEQETSDPVDVDSGQDVGGETTTPSGEEIPSTIDPESGDTSSEETVELPKPTTKSSSGGNKVVPIIAGVAAAGAAGVGAKVFLDKKTNNDISDDDWEESEEYTDSGSDLDLDGDYKDNSTLDSSDEFTYKADIDEDYSDEDIEEDNFSDVTEEEEVQGYQAINFNDISETH